MIKTILGVLGLVVIGIICLFLWCACVVSSRSDNNGR
jgi:hypothetical protein